MSLAERVVLACVHQESNCNYFFTARASVLLMGFFVLWLMSCFYFYMVVNTCEHFGAY